MANQTKAPKRTLSNVVAGLLRDRILDGRFAPGAQLNEVELATFFETSRGPLREAIQRLVQEGLLVSYPHRGVFVPEFTTEDLEDIFVAREALERAALRKVTSRGVSASLVADLEVIVADMRTAAHEGDRGALARLDLAFHRRLVSAAGSRRLDRLYGLIANEMQLCLRMIVDAYSDRTELHAEHEELLRIIASGDRAAALAHLDHHFADADDREAAVTGAPIRHPHQHTHVLVDHTHPDPLEEP